MGEDLPFKKRCGCGKLIVMVKTTEGKIVPIDESAPVYRPAILDPAGRWERIPDAGVNHFTTCPNANDYTRTKKSRGESSETNQQAG